MMKKSITIYGNNQFILELMRDFLDANGFSKLHPIFLISSSQEIEQIDVAKIEFLILNLTAENISEKFELIDKWLLLNSEMKIIVLSRNSDVKIIKRLFDKGIKAYLGKNTGSEEFLKSIQSAKKGLVYINEDTKNDLFNYICSVNDPDREKPSGADELTAREMDVLNLICEGLRTKEIAEKLFISVHTVESHRRNIMLKLNINNSSRLVKYAIDNSLVK